VKISQQCIQCIGSQHPATMTLQGKPDKTHCLQPCSDHDYQVKYAHSAGSLGYSTYAKVPALQFWHEKEVPGPENWPEPHGVHWAEPKTELVPA